MGAGPDAWLMPLGRCDRCSAVRWPGRWWSRRRPWLVDCVRVSIVVSVLAGACAGTAPTPSPTPSEVVSTSVPTVPPQTSTPSPRATLSPAVRQGTTTLKGTYTFDFENGVSGVPSQADVWWEQVDSVRRYLVPQNGAAIGRLGAVDFDTLTLSQLRTEPYTYQRLDASDTGTNQLRTGTVVAVRTRHGQYAKMRVESYGFDLRITWVTYP